MRILLVVHGVPPAAAAGTEIYVEALASALAIDGKDEVFVLTREADTARSEYAVRREDRGRVCILHINNTFRACTSFEESYTNPALLDVAKDLIAEIDPDVAHVHHLTCLSTGLMKLLRDRGIPTALTLHDYWMLCHRGQLFDLDGRRCGGPIPDGCTRCVPAAALAPAASYTAARYVRGLDVPGVRAAVRVVEQVVNAVTSTELTRTASAARLAAMAGALHHTDLVLAPSDTIASHFLRLGIPAERLERCDLGLSFPSGSIRAARKSTVLHVAFVGALIPSKAPHLLLQAAALLPAGSVTVDVIGAATPYHGAESYSRVLALLLKAPFVRHCGPVPHDEVAGRLADVDVLVLPSVWIENSPLVIREAFAAGIPVIASDLGGMAEMVTHDVNGLLFPAGDAPALAAALRRLQDDPDLLERLRAGIEPPMSIDADASRLRATYQRLISLARGPSAVASSTVKSYARDRAGAPQPDITARTAIAAVVLNYKTPDQTWLAVRSLQTSFAPPARVIVVDNASADRSAETLRGSLRDVDVLETERNLGFSGGCNVGITAALAGRAEYVLLVNSDAVLAPDAVGLLAGVADRDRTVGIVGPLLLERAEPDRIASAGISYSRRSGRMRHLAVGEPSAALDGEPIREVDAVSGCVMLVRRQVFETAGLLDEDYFFSFEDLDLCLRAGTAGFRTLCVPAARAYHEGCRSIGSRSPRRVYFATRNHLKLATEIAPATAPVRILRSGVVVGLNLAYVVVSPDAPLLAGLAAVVRGSWHHATGRYGSD